MYEWVTHTINPVAMNCHTFGHRCVYCYIEKFAAPALTLKYHQDKTPRLVRKELHNWGCGRTIFVQNCGDLFAQIVPHDIIQQVLDHCQDYPLNTYLFQTANPWRFQDFELWEYPPRVVFCTTIESNRAYPEINNEPHPIARATAMRALRARITHHKIGRAEDTGPMSKAAYGHLLSHPAYNRQVREHSRRRGTDYSLSVTVEPVMQFDLLPFRDMLAGIGPKFVSIGANSRRDISLPEPTRAEVEALIAKLPESINIKLKANLKHLKEE